MTTLPLIDKDITKIVGLQGYRIKEVRRIEGGMRWKWNCQTRQPAPFAARRQARCTSGDRSLVDCCGDLLEGSGCG
jgi:hypothetical protein